MDYLLWKALSIKINFFCISPIWFLHISSFCYSYRPDLLRHQFNWKGKVECLWLWWNENSSWTTVGITMETWNHPTQKMSILKWMDQFIWKRHDLIQDKEIKVMIESPQWSKRISQEEAKSIFPGPHVILQSSFKKGHLWESNIVLKGSLKEKSYMVWSQTHW